MSKSINKLKDFFNNYFLTKNFIKAIIPILALLVVYLFFVFGLLIPTLEKNLFNEKTEMTKRLIELIFSDLNARHKEIIEHDLDLNTEKEKILRRYEKLRFGKQDKDYFWIIDNRNYLIMHPLLPYLVNVHPKTYIGPDGKKLNILINQMVETTKNTGSGLIEYLWWSSNDPHFTVKKMAYVRKFKPWGWVIGTGIYLEDLQAELSKWKLKLTLIGLFITIGTIVIYLVLTYKNFISRNLENESNKRLRQNEETFRKLFEQSNDPTFLMEKGIVIDCNDALLELFHFSNKFDIIGKKLSDFSSELQGGSFNSLFNSQHIFSLPEDREYSRFEWTLQRSDGIMIPTDVSLTKIKLFEKNLNYVVLRDISEQKKIQAELKQNEQRIKTTLLSIGEAVISTDLSGSILEMNKIAEQLLEYKIKDESPKKIFELLCLNDIDNNQSKSINKCSIEELMSILDKSMQFILISQKAHSIRISINARYIRTESGILEGIVFVFRDISKEYMMRSDLRKKEILFKTIFETSPFSILIQGLKDYKYLLANQSYLKSISLKEEQVIGKTPDEIGAIFNKEDIKKFYILLMDKGKIDNMIINSVRPNGKKAILLFSARKILYEGEECALTISNDITDIRTKQNKFYYSEKMASLEQLSGKMSHDLNNILGGIIGITELMLDNKESEEEQEKHLKLIRETSKGAISLINKLLIFSRKNKLEMSQIDLHKVINDAVEILKGSISSNTKIETDFKATQSFVMGDDALIRNVYLELGVNADYAMPNGGVIKYTSSLVELDKAKCDNFLYPLTPGTYILTEITDNGNGIAEDIQQKIFEPFFTTKAKGKGKGLGLSQVYGTVREHNGEIQITSKIDSGTNIKIYLPVTKIHEKNQESNTTELNKETLSGTNKSSILVVDDEFIIQVMIKAVLENMGYKVFVASSGKEAIEIYKEHIPEIKLILLDMLMPEMSGKECFLILKESNPDVNVIMASGITHEDEIKELKKQGLKSFINKPYNTKELKVLVDKFLS